MKRDIKADLRLIWKREWRLHQTTLRFRRWWRETEARLFR